MKRAIATAAIVGVGFFGASIPAALADAGDDAGGSGHNCQVSGSDDDYSGLALSVKHSPGGSDDDCGNEGPGGGYEEPAYEEPPVEQPPVEQPAVEQPPVEQPAVEQPPVEQPPVAQPIVKPIAKPVVKPVVKPVTKPVAKPVAAAPAMQPAPAAAAPVPAADNAGLNVQTAAGAGSEPDAGIPAWLAAITGLFAALAGGVLVKSGIRSRKPEA
jgi:hypothetical protein